MNEYIAATLAFRVNSTVSRSNIVAMLTALVENKDCYRYDIRTSSHEEGTDSNVQQA